MAGIVQDVRVSSGTFYLEHGQVVEVLHEVPCVRPVCKRAEKEGKVFSIDLSSKRELCTAHFHKYPGPPAKSEPRKKVWSGVEQIDLCRPEYALLAKMVEHYPVQLVTRHVAGFFAVLDAIDNTGTWKGIEKRWLGVKKMPLHTKELNEVTKNRFRKLKNKLGGGTFGDVYEGHCPVPLEFVAIKYSLSKLHSTFFSIQELFTAIKMQKFPNIPRLRGFFLKNSNCHAVVYERIPETLHHTLFQRRLEGQLFSLQEIACFASEMLSTLDSMHPRNIHTDIAHSNIFFNFTKSMLRLMDLGGIKDARIDVLPEVITQQPFRSPESIIGDYNYKTDIFSFGCVLFGLLALDYLFPLERIKPFVDTVTKETIEEDDILDNFFQLAMITEVLGPLPQKMIDLGKNTLQYYFLSRGKYELKFALADSYPSLQKRFNALGRTEEGMKDLEDLITQCLTLDPEVRPSAKELRGHPFLKRFIKSAEKDEKKSR